MLVPEWYIGQLFQQISLQPRIQPRLLLQAACRHRLPDQLIDLRVMQTPAIGAGRARSSKSTSRAYSKRLMRSEVASVAKRGSRLMGADASPKRMASESGVAQEPISRQRMSVK